MNLPATLDERRAILDRISRKVIGCAHQVSNALGAGFLEKVYENALAFELRYAGLETVQQRRIEVRSLCLLVNFGCPKAIVKRIVHDF
jgi:hypothetical protein